MTTLQDITQSKTHEERIENTNNYKMENPINGIFANFKQNIEIFIANVKSSRKEFDGIEV